MKTTPAGRRHRSIADQDYYRMIRRMLKSAGDRAAAADVDSLAQLLELRDLVDQVAVAAVKGLRDSGHTWEEIGAATGTTRQAALMRWAPRMRGPTP